MEPPRHPMRIHGPKPIEGAAENLATMAVQLIPKADSRVRVTWKYLVTGGETVSPIGFELEPSPMLDAREWPHIGPTLIRDLPLAKLERAARMAAEFDIRQKPGGGFNLGPSWGRVPDPAEIPETARAMVRERYPDLDPKSGAGAARRWNRLVRLAEVVQEHEAARARGAESPATVIAQARGVEPVTVRGWLHQAKREGFEPRPFVGGLDIFDEISDHDPAGGITET